MERDPGAVALNRDAEDGQALGHGGRSAARGRGPGPELRSPGRDSEPSAGAGAASGAGGTPGRLGPDVRPAASRSNITGAAKADKSEDNDTRNRDH